MSGFKNKTFTGDEIEEVTFGINKIVVKLKDGSKFSCKPVGSMNFTAKLNYNKDISKIGSTNI